ncbi:putative galactolipase [Helianthus annuus]|nr:putative galactolipase [Helianthus annuus]
MRLGGLGLFSARDVGAYAFVASRAQSWELQDHILRNGGVAGLDPDYQHALERLNVSLPDLDIGGFSNKDTAPSKPQKTLANALFSKIAQSLGEAFDLSPRQKAVFECLKGPHAQEFLTVIPIEGLGQCMSAVEYRTILKYRLMIPMYPEDETYPICRKACMDKYGEHAVHCKELPGFKYRHDGVRDVLGDILRRAGISAKKEAPVNFLTDPMEGRSTLRPADLLVFGWAGGKHACVDLTGVSHLVGLRENGFVAGLAARKAESKKVDKHAKACAENQHVFIHFAFDTFGSLAPEAINFLTRVQQLKKHPSLDAKLSDICIGTSAAPTYLPSHSFQTEDSTGNLLKEFNLIDGGVAANNPTLVAISEVTKEITIGSPNFFPIKPMDYGRFLVLSLGTGSLEFQEKYDAAKSSSWGVLGWLAGGGSTPLVDVFSHASSDMVDYHISTVFQALHSQENYLRIQVFVDFVSKDLFKLVQTMLIIRA